jgi:hypothetical protein
MPSGHAGSVPCHAMPDRFSDRSPDRPSEDELRAQAAFQAGRSASGIGAAVASSGYGDGEHFWECIVTDGEEWHFIRVLGVDLAPSSDLPIGDIEQGIERFAATSPESYRLSALVNTNPLHVDRSGTVGA